MKNLETGRTSEKKSPLPKPITKNEEQTMVLDNVKIVETHLEHIFPTNLMT